MSEWKYWLESDGYTEVITRKTKPRMGSTISHDGKKWEVWYIEEGLGVQNARCEPLPEPPVSANMPT